MAEYDTYDYRCTVTLVLEDVTEATAAAFFSKGVELESGHPVTGYLATIDDAGRVERVGP